MIKMSFVLLLGLAAVAALRRRSAALRHFVLAATLGCAALTPLLQRVVPAWHLPIAASMFGARPDALPLYIPIQEAHGGDASVLDAAPARVSVLARLLRAAVPLWIAGIAINLMLLLIGFARLMRLASRSEVVRHGRWVELADTLSRHNGLRRRATLRLTEHPSLLVTWGVRRPAIMLPAAARDWQDDRIRIVLGHELAHIRRRDWLIQIGAEVTRAVYWFNPLVWIACRRLRLESEHACDDVVLNLGVEGPEYAEHLLDLARAFRRDREASLLGFPAPAMARPSSLERRVSAMLSSHHNRTPVSPATSLIIVLAVFMTVVPIAGIVASAQNRGATFSGSLVDAVGRVLPDVPLTLTTANGSQKHQTRSDQTGTFSFKGLAAGDYTLEAEKVGFATTQGRVQLGAGQQLKQDVALQLGLLNETINIVDLMEPEAPRASKRAPSRSHSADDDPCGQVTVGGCIQPPLKLVDVKPIYPQAFHRTGTNATVQLEARIGTDGFINDVKAVAPVRAEFAAAAMEAVRQWAFSQTRLDGVPVEVRMHIAVTFTGAQ